MDSGHLPTLLISQFRLFTDGDCSFPVAGPRTCNNLPEAVRPASSLPSFKRQLINVLYHVVIPNINIPPSLIMVDLAVFKKLEPFETSALHNVLRYQYCYSGVPQGSVLRGAINIYFAYK